MKYLRFSDLAERGILRNRATLSRWIQELGFPRGVLLGPNTRAWTEEEVDARLAVRAAERGVARAKRSARSIIPTQGLCKGGRRFV